MRLLKSQGCCSWLSMCSALECEWCRVRAPNAAPNASCGTGDDDDELLDVTVSESHPPVQICELRIVLLGGDAKAERSAGGSREDRTER